MRNPVWVRLILVLAVLFGVIAVWRWSPLAAFVRPEVLADWGSALRGQWWGYAAAIGAFLSGGLIVFPLSVLITAAILVFGPAAGFAVSFLGALVSAVANYLIGEFLGRWRPELFSPGGRVGALSKALAKRGILSMALIRQMPVPYSLVSYAAGVSHIRLLDYVAGTAIGLLPWLVAFTLLTDRFLRMLQNPSLGNAAVLVVIVIVVVGFSYTAMRVSRWWLGRRRNGY